jgi:uncharacterized protein YjiK
MMKVALRICIVFVCFVFFFLGSWENEKQFMYDLSKPDKRITLPAVLHEVSGLTEIDSTSFVCIQDENGVLFFYDLIHNRISRELPFAYNGDYEGVTRVGRSIYVLRSDGALYEIPDLNAESAQTVYHMNSIPAHNNEGLCYDPLGHRLLVGSKGKVDDEARVIRTIYAFDLETKKISPEPVYKFDITKVTDFAVKRNLIEPYKTTPKGKRVPRFVKFQTSEIAIHPITGDLYILSANDHMLLIFSRSGELKHIEKLSVEFFNKPEGITFFANGDMLITNEGQQNYPTLLRFNMKRP